MTKRRFYRPDMLSASEVRTYTWMPRVVFAAAVVTAFQGSWAICALQLALATLMHFIAQRVLAANRQRSGEE
jgi:hypothetical protein